MLPFLNNSVAVYTHKSPMFIRSLTVAEHTSFSLFSHKNTPPVSMMY